MERLAPPLALILATSGCLSPMIREAGVRTVPLTPEEFRIENGDKLPGEKIVHARREAAAWHYPAQALLVPAFVLDAALVGPLYIVLTLMLLAEPD